MKKLLVLTKIYHFTGEKNYFYLIEKESLVIKKHYNMNIRRAQRPKTYTNIDNKLINDTRLSAASLGVLIYLLSKPDNWTALKPEIKKRFSTDRNKLSSTGLDNCFKEMRDAGYAKLKPIVKKGKDGKNYFKGSEYVIFDESNKPLSNITDSVDLRDSENLPTPEHSPTSEISETPKNGGVNITTTDKPLTNKEDKEINGKNLPIPSFSDFWDLYDYKKNKATSEKSWTKLTNLEKMRAIEAIPQYLVFLAKNNHPQCHASTWLNQKRWEDDNSIKTTKTPKPETIDTHTLPPALEELYKKGLEKYNTKTVAQRISYFTKKEFQSWMKGGVNFEKHRDRGILTEQKIYKKIKDTINRLNSSSFDQKCTGCLVDFVELAFSNKIKQIG
jgi:hypothetical protein